MHYLIQAKMPVCASESKSTKYLSEITKYYFWTCKVGQIWFILGYHLYQATNHHFIHSRYFQKGFLRHELGHLKCLLVSIVFIAFSHVNKLIQFLVMKDKKVYLNGGREYCKVKFISLQQFLFLTFLAKSKHFLFLLTLRLCKHKTYKL